MTTQSSDHLSRSEDDNEEVKSKLIQNDTKPYYGTVPEDDEILTKKAKKKRRYISIVVMMFTMLVSSICFSIIFASVWPYFQQVDEDANPSFLGFIVAAFSFGQLVAAPIFGFWSNHRPVMEPVIVSLVVSLSGSILYIYAEAFENGKWVLLFSRLIIGIGSGNIAITRSYLSAASWENERSTVMSLLSATQGLGFILGPAFGLIFQPLGEEGVKWPAIQLHLNLYTGPGFLQAFLCIINILVLVFFFKEFNVHGTKRKMPLKEMCKWCSRIAKKNKEGSKMSRMDNSVGGISDMTVSVVSNPAKLLEKYDVIAAWACVVMFFLILVVFSALETLLAPIGEDEYGWTQSEATFNVNLIVTVNSAIAIVTFFGTRMLVKWIPERLVFIGGMVIMAMGCAVWLPYAGHPKMGGPVNVTDGNQSHIVVLPGCNPDDRPWCDHQPKVYLFQYLIGLPTLTIGYCASSLLCYTIFSKIIGPWPQGLMMGFISVSGSSGRAVGPLALAALYDKEGPLAAYLLCIGLTAVGTVILLVFITRLIPYSAYIEKKNKKSYVRLVNDDNLS